VAFKFQIDVNLELKLVQQTQPSLSSPSGAPVKAEILLMMHPGKHSVKAAVNYVKTQ